MPKAATIHDYKTEANPVSTQPNPSSGFKGKGQTIGNKDGAEPSGPNSGSSPGVERGKESGDTKASESRANNESPTSSKIDNSVNLPPETNFSGAIGFMFGGTPTVHMNINPTSEKKRSGHGT